MVSRRRIWDITMDWQTVTLTRRVRYWRSGEGIQAVEKMSDLVTVAPGTASMKLALLTTRGVGLRRSAWKSFVQQDNKVLLCCEPTERELLRDKAEKEALRSLQTFDRVV